MALLLGESLLASKGFDVNDVARRWVKWMKVDGRGIGIRTKRALTLIDRGKEPFEAGQLANQENPGRSAGNGSVMRCVHVALRYHDDPDRLIRVSTQQAALIALAQAGGDTDTNAAVAGALLGARYGDVALPPRWIDQITGSQGIAQLAERLVSAL